MTAPTYKCEIAFTTNVFDDPGTYTDVTAYLRGFSIRRGRDGELDRTQAGTATVRLANADRRFDPTYGDQNLFPRYNQRDVEAALDATDFTATNGATFSRTTTAGQFNQGLAGLSVTAHATNTNSGVTVGSSGGITALAPVPQHNVTYSYSVYVKGATAVTFYIMVTWVDQAGVPISTTATSNQVASTSAFVRIKHEALTPPAGTKYARCQILFPTAGAGQTLYADQFQFERAQNASDWIATGPYYPNVVPMKKIRLTMTHNAVDYRLFTGFIEDWGQTYAPRPIQGAGTAEVTVTASDAFKLLSLIDLTSYSDAVLADEPVGYWVLNEANAAETVTNLGSAEADGAYTAGDFTFGNAGPLVGAATAPSQSATGQVSINNLVAVPDLTPPVTKKNIGSHTMEAWIYPTSLAATRYIVFGVGQSEFRVNTDGSMRYAHNQAGGGNPQTATSDAVVTTNNWQHVAVVRENNMVTFYRNGVQCGVRTVTGSPYVLDSPTAIGSSNSSLPWSGRLAHVALYNKALSAERIATHYARTLGPMAAQKTGAAIIAVLGVVGFSGWSVGDGKTVLPPHETTGSALEYLLSIAEDAERGLLYVAGDGTLTFVDRDALLRDTVTQTDFGDGTFGTTSEINYADLSLTYDDSFLYSVVTVSREGEGAAGITVQDTTSKTKYGPRTLQLDGLRLPSDSEVTDLANYLLSRFKDPHMRISTMTLVGATNNFHLNEIHNRVLGDRVAVERRPPGGGLIYSMAEIVGIEHDMPTVGTFTTTFKLAPVRNLPPFWILAHTTYGVLDSTTTLGY